jgi:hypothetical protein
MKKIMVAIVTLMFGLGASAQVDSLHGGTKAGTVHESDGDLNNVNRDSKLQENPVLHDSVQVHSTEKSKMQSTPHTRDSSGTTTGQQKKANGSMQNPKPVPHENSGVKPSSPTKQEPPKQVGTDKDKMYLVPDSTIKK